MTDYYRYLVVDNIITIVRTVAAKLLYHVIIVVSKTLQLLKFAGDVLAGVVLGQVLLDEGPG